MVDGQVLAEMRSKMTSKDKSKKKIKAPSDQDMLKFAEEIAAAINAGQVRRRGIG